MQKFKAAALLTLALAVALVAGGAAQSRWSDIAHDVTSWDKSQTAFAAQSAAGYTAIVRVNAHIHGEQLIVAGGPSGCTYRLQGSNDAVTFADLDGSDVTCTTSGVYSFLVDKPVIYIRGHLLTLTGGTMPTVTLKYAGY